MTEYTTLSFFQCVRPFLSKDKGLHFDIHPHRCSALSKPRIQDYTQVFQNGPPVVKWPESIVDDDDIEAEALKISASNGIKERVAIIKSMLESMEDGEISVSAYDTAWVGLVPDVNGSGEPQFPSSLVWIANNQLSDGSWGDTHIFSAHDRLINTLACVLALKSWNLHPDKCEKGMKFFRENLYKIEDENDEHMPIGFEVAFPSLLEIARSLNVEIEEDSPVLQKIYAMRNLKLTRIPRDIMHNVPTTLLHSLEGMTDLDWEKLLKLQSSDGSFLFSPSSTAFALMQTKDQKCLTYLQKAVQRFNGGVPNVYPVDMFEHIWAVDRLQRLGISRYFKPQIKECIDYVHRYWDENGICWARNTPVHDIDDTAMGFRLMRLHGYDVSADVFENFKKGEEFFCFAGQSNQAVTGMFNLYRASQVSFPGEKILEDAKQFSFSFLRNKQEANELLDKWIITKDLPGEVGFALEIPWYASLARVETRFYIEQYGGEDDVWIGKTLYRMPYVNNNAYLELAKLDYNNCQAIHQMEWRGIQKWFAECKLEEYGSSRRSLLLAYFVAAASTYEPERSRERLAWAKTLVLTDAITAYFHDLDSTESARRNFLNEFKLVSVNPSPYLNFGRRSSDSNRGVQRLIATVIGTLNHISLDALVGHGRDVTYYLHQAWENWLVRWQEEGDGHKEEAELLVQIINLSAGHYVSEELLSHPQYKQLSTITNQLCHKLGRYRSQKVQDYYCSYDNNTDIVERTVIEHEMQQLVQLVLQNSSDDIDSDVKQTFLSVAKSFYYSAYCDLGTINYHIAKVLFEKVN
ncbi:ent-copalyl diphosphate synthase, chloroplastic [Carica papaya]|uniref:ent-copalyl diphosphate synthase, chloroplastic n=1 Tax=Carica papaya TaxID=3649 RepID=UPI000B8D1603|nr:ent-copalyl diphosphate synthase, chloroplastic [Carica papaya]